MMMNNETKQAVQEAKDILADARARGADALGSSWEDVRKTLLTPEERAVSAIRVQLMTALIDARNEQGISQKRLEELSGVRQPIIARMEKGHTSPQLDTILKVLAPLGKTLQVCELQEA
jgi:predicted XRE-type DNA-binding protein